MPLVYRSELQNGLLALWKITESEQELAALCTPQEQTYATAALATESRRREWLAWHALLHTVAPGLRAEYNAVGAPIVDKGHISVSHTTGFCALLLSSRSCGIDIEQRGRNFPKVASRFVSESEKTLISMFNKEESADIDNDSLCRVWCSKEALYKVAATEGLDFLNDIRITSWTPATPANAHRLSPSMFLSEINSVLNLTADVRNTSFQVQCMFYEGLCIAFCTT